MTILAVVVAFSLITNPISLLVLGGLLAAWVFLYLFRPSDPPLVLFGRTFADRETLGLLSVSSVVVTFLTSVRSLLISAILIGLGIIFLGLGGFNSASNPVPPPPTVTGMYLNLIFFRYGWYCK
ncbi:hypothetical protein MKW92_010422 [Papaver armeniacum]|nr:hypothetical protein MKW92_010422 [Papaver armeniacum]